MKLRALVCALLRHSNIESCCMGYISCARCGQQVGDTLAGCYRNPLQVGTDCACEACEANVPKLKFADVFLTPMPAWLGNAQTFRDGKEKSRKEFRSYVESLRR